MAVALIANHCTTWHDGGAALLLSDGAVVALAAERVGDRYKHSWNSRLAYDYLRHRFAPDDATVDLFVDCSTGLQQDDHHLYHAEAAFFQSGFDTSAVLVIDGQGPGHGHVCTASIWQAGSDGLELVDDLLSGEGNFADRSIGHFYSAITAASGFSQLNTEGSAMALAAYGRESPYLSFFHRFIQVSDDDVSVTPDLTRSILSHTYGADFYGWPPPNDGERAIWSELNSLRETTGEWPTQDDMNMAWAGQRVLEEAVLALVRRAKRLTGEDNLCLVGGVALNCVANERVARSGIFSSVFVPSAPGDDGQAVGRLVHEARERGLQVKRSASPFLGPAYNEFEVADAVMSVDLGIGRVVRASDDELVAMTVDKISAGRLVGWARGRSEWGPRALGNRSILGDARITTTRSRMNATKGRQYFRPVHL